MAKRSPYESSVGRPLAGAGLVHGSGHMLTRIHMLADRFASLYLLRCGLETGVELPSAVECSHDHVPALMAFRVIPVVMDDVTSQAVVLGVNSGHSAKSCIAADANPARQRAGSGRICNRGRPPAPSAPGYHLLRTSGG